MISMRLVAPLLLCGGLCQAQDARDDAIFGGASALEAPAKAEDPSTTSGLADTMAIGGRLEFRVGTSQQEEQIFQKGELTALKQADVYFDTRPNRDVRAFLRTRFLEQAAQSLVTQVDELWFKWDHGDSLFVTAGKQHLKWGSGRFWNPTDFTSGETRDPFALFDRRLGRELIKLHVPIEKQGYNFYAIVQLDDATKNEDAGGALRGEFAFGGSSELALTVQSRPHAPLNAGFDLSSGIGPVDVAIESAISKRQQRTFFEGEIEPSLGKLPLEKDRFGDTFVQTVLSISKTWKYSDDDSVTFGGEYFDNQLGYDERELGLYSLILGESPSLYVGRRYAGALVRLPSPGSFNDASFYLNGLKNLSDETSVVRLTTSVTMFKNASFDATLSHCQGDYGELCFRVPDDFLALAASPSYTPEQKARLAALPTKRTRMQAALGLSMNF